MSNNRLLKSNPKCIVEQTLVSDKTPATVEFTFKNDHKWVFPASGRSDNEILMEVRRASAAPRLALLRVLAGCSD